MSRRLYLLRHAKSSWDDPDLSDHDRPLAPRGQSAAAAMAPVAAALAPRPGLVVCSTAVRARQTLDGVASGLTGVPQWIAPAAYTFQAEALLVLLRGLDADLGAVLVIGHNPALEEVAQRVAPQGDGPAMARLRTKYPTAALAVIESREATAAWADLGPGWGRLVAFTRPRDVGGGAPM